MGAGGNHACIHIVHYICNFRGGTTRHLLDFLHRVEFVARINTLGAVTGKKVHVELQPAHALHHRNALVLGHAGIHGALVHHDVALADDLAHRLACSPQRAQIRVIIYIDWRGHRHHIEIAVANRLKVGRAAEAVIKCAPKQVVGHFQRRIMTLHQGIDTSLAHIETNRGVLRREQPRQRQPNVPQSNHTNFYILHIQIIIVNKLYELVRIVNYSFARNESIHQSFVFKASFTKIH